MPTYLINGDLFVKILPDKKTIWHKNVDGRVEFFDSKTGLSKEVQLDEVPEQVLKDYEKFGLVSSKELINDNIGLYQIFFNGTTYYMINVKTKEINIYTSYQEIEEKYLNLYDFIKKGHFLFRMFESVDRTKPRYEALLSYGQIHLLKNENNEYLIININSSEFQDYQFSYFITNETKSETYQRVIHSIINSKGKGLS